MKHLLLLSLILNCLNCLGQEKVTIVGEIRFGDYSKFRYRESVQINLGLKTYDQSETMPFKVIDIYKKEKYDNPPGTEIVFEVPYSLYKTISSSTSKTLKMICSFRYPTRISHRFTTSNVILEADLSKADIYNDNTVKLGEPILLTAPEKMTLTMMLEDVDSDLFSMNDKGLAEAVIILDRRFSDYYDQKEIEYPVLLNFYRLLIYTERFVAENSFFNNEAKKLNNSILAIEKQLYNDSIPSDIYRNTLLDDYTTSTEVYKDYLEGYSRLKDYNSRLKLILFLKGR